MGILVYTKQRLGKYYEPSLLPDYSPETHQLTHDKLIQYDIRDVDEQLIPTWKIESGLRPGTVVLVTALLHVYNIKNERVAGFRRARTTLVMS